MIPGTKSMLDAAVAHSQKMASENQLDNSAFRIWQNVNTEACDVERTDQWVVQTSIQEAAGYPDIAAACLQNVIDVHDPEIFQRKTLVKWFATDWALGAYVDGSGNVWCTIMKAYSVIFVGDECQQASPKPTILPYPTYCPWEDWRCLNYANLYYTNQVRDWFGVPHLRIGIEAQLLNAISWSSWLAHSWDRQERGSHLIHQYSFKDLGYGCYAALIRENLAFVSTSHELHDLAMTCVDTWKNSHKGHYENLFDDVPKFAALGVYVHSDNTVWCTQTGTQTGPHGDIPECKTALPSSGNQAYPSISPSPPPPGSR